MSALSPWALPPVMRHLRPSAPEMEAACFTKKEFATLLAEAKFDVESILERGRYLPLSLPFGRIPWPMPAFYIAIVTKPRDKK